MPPPRPPTASLLLWLLLAAAGCPGADDDAGADDDGAGADDDDDGADDDDADDDDAGGCAADLSAAVGEVVASVVTVRWDQPAAAPSWIERRGEDGSWEAATPAVQRDGGAAEQIVLGLPYDTAVDLRVGCDTGDGPRASDPVTVTTGPLPEGLTPPALLASDPGAEDPAGRYLLLSLNTVAGDWTGGRFYTVIVDRAGRLVWAYPTPGEHWTLAARPSRDGATILVDELTTWSDWDDGAGSLVHRLTLDGAVVETIAIPGAHHDVAELDDGTLLWGAASGSLSETLERRAPDGTRDTVWDCATYEDPDHASAACQSNTVTWSAETDTALVSLHTTSTVLEIDLTSGALLREIGHSAASWGFDPPDAAFHMQHGPRLTDAGTLLTSTWSDADGLEVVVREYELDAETETARLVYSAGEGDGVEAANGGDVARLPGGNTLHSCGTAGRVREFTPQGVVAWEIAWEEGQLLGRATWLDDLYAFAP